MCSRASLVLAFCSGQPALLAVGATPAEPAAGPVAGAVAPVPASAGVFGAVFPALAGVVVVPVLEPPACALELMPVGVAELAAPALATELVAFTPAAAGACGAPLLVGLLVAPLDVAGGSLAQPAPNSTQLHIAAVSCARSSSRQGRSPMLG